MGQGGLDGKVAVITGGASGMGRATVARSHGTTGRKATVRQVPA